VLLSGAQQNRFRTHVTVCKTVRWVYCMTRSPASFFTLSFTLAFILWWGIVRHILFVLALQLGTKLTDALFMCLIFNSIRWYRIIIRVYPIYFRYTAIIRGITVNYWVYSESLKLHFHLLDIIILTKNAQFLYLSLKLYFFITISQYYYFTTFQRLCTMLHYKVCAMY
jgi:hypothetical protein